MLLNMESGYQIVTIRVIWTSWAHIWRLHSPYLGTRYDITPDEGCAILHDNHAGICGSHVGARSRMGKAHRQGFFWPTAVSDADSLVRRCEGVNFSLARSTCHLNNCRPYLLPGLFLHGGWIWKVRLRKPNVDSHTSSLHKLPKWIEVKSTASITVAKAVEFIK
jgi:hypothetical protein